MVGHEVLISMPAAIKGGRQQAARTGGIEQGDNGGGAGWGPEPRGYLARAMEWTNVHQHV